MPPIPSAGLQLPKGTLKKLSLGQSFAEYDKLLERDNVYVETPGLRAALDDGQGKCFFVGRRGTGKTAITLYLEKKVPGKVIAAITWSRRTFLRCIYYAGCSPTTVQVPSPGSPSLEPRSSNTEPSLFNTFPFHSNDIQRIH